MTITLTKIIKIITLLFFVISIAVGKSEGQNNTNNSSAEALGQKPPKGQVIEPEWHRKPLPRGCNDESGKLIFNPSVDGQEVLDKIIKKQGKQGTYNKMPKVKPRHTFSETTYEDD